MMDLCVRCNKPVADDEARRMRACLANSPALEVDLGVDPVHEDCVTEEEWHGMWVGMKGTLQDLEIESRFLAMAKDRDDQL
jgi:hypothetical protein